MPAAFLADALGVFAEVGGIADASPKQNTNAAQPDNNTRRLRCANDGGEPPPTIWDVGLSCILELLVF